MSQKDDTATLRGDSGDVTLCYGPLGASGKPRSLTQIWFSDTTGLWMNQIGPKPDGCSGRHTQGKRYLIHDRDPLFTAEFLSLLGDAS
jgi:hypothetical protein